MKQIDSIQLFPGSDEEQLPDYTPDFPCITTRASLYKYADPRIPWHWHSAGELFYMESGTLEYTTPSGTWIFPAGSGGFVNANVLHSSRILSQETPTVQLLHLFDPSFLAGSPGGRLYQKYIYPLTASGVELIPLLPGESPVLPALRDSFSISEESPGYEFTLRQALTEIWLELLGRIPDTTPVPAPGDNAVKSMMAFVHRHFGEDITVDDIARAGLVSRRSCFRLFQQQLHTTPTLYLRDYRLRQACALLAHSNATMTEIANACCLGSSSYFGQQFRESYGITPSRYRKQWHDIKK